jgi:hypothetical protein
VEEQKTHCFWKNDAGLGGYREGLVLKFHNFARLTASDKEKYCRFERRLRKKPDRLLRSGRGATGN